MKPKTVLQKTWRDVWRCSIASAIPISISFFFDPEAFLPAIGASLFVFGLYCRAQHQEYKMQAIREAND